MQGGSRRRIRRPAFRRAQNSLLLRSPRQRIFPLSRTIPAKQAREAEDAYLQGAKEVERKDLEAAEKSFVRATQLNPNNRDYALALIVTREHRLTELVQQAAKQRELGNNQRAEELLVEARKLDPDNAVIAQHFGSSAIPAGSELLPDNSIANSLGGPVKLEPKPGKQDVHLRGNASAILRQLYSQFGIAASMDSSVRSLFPIRLDLEGVTFEQAARIASEMTKTFAIPVQAHTALIAEDTADNRKRLKPQEEETLYMPGLQEGQMTEMANLARAVFDLTSVTASPTTDTIVLRGDPDNLKILNATYDSLLSGNSDVMLDIKLYEVDRTHTRNIGFQLPSSFGIFSIVQEAQQLVTSNQSLISQAIAAGVIKLSGNPLTDLLAEVAFLIGTGAASAAQFGNIIGVVGNGLTLSGRIHRVAVDDQPAPELERRPHARCPAGSRRHKSGRDLPRRDAISDPDLYLHLRCSGLSGLIHRRAEYQRQQRRFAVAAVPWQ